MTPGRKPKPGKRYKNGRLKPRPENPRDTVIQARMRQNGISAEVALHAEMGYTLGRLIPKLFPDHRGANKDQARKVLEAGNEFAETMRSFLISAGMGGGTAVALDPDRIRGRGADKDVKDQAKARLYSEALREIDRVNYQLVKCPMPSAHKIVWDVCVLERDDTMLPLTPAEKGVLLEGLNRIYQLMPQEGRKAA